MGLTVSHLDVASLFPFLSVDPLIDLEENAGNEKSWVFLCGDTSDEEWKQDLSTMCLRFQSVESECAPFDLLSP